MRALVSNMCRFDSDAFREYTTVSTVTRFMLVWFVNASRVRRFGSFRFVNTLNIRRLVSFRFARFSVLSR